MHGERISSVRRGFFMKRLVLRIVLGAVVVLLFGLAYAVYNAQRADFSWHPTIKKPQFTELHPRVVIDEAHNNASTAGIGGRYWPLARLLKRDGYDVQQGTDSFSAPSLKGVEVLIIANAAGAPKPQFLGINLPAGTNKDRGSPAFTAQEIDAVSTWVGQGGSLLLIADHAPFGAASEALAAAFKIRMYKGFLEVPDEPSDPLLFSRENGRLGEHPILSGNGPETAVSRVMTFTGQSLAGPPEAVILLRLPAASVELKPAGKGESKPLPAGNAQGLALSWGEGRVVVLGEAAMLTAQVASGVPFGMNSPGNDNQQLALNIMHWLSHKL
jgi:hypothetical protein